MLASLADAPLDDPQLVYEPKYDGIRAIAEVPLSARVRLWSRLGNEKTSQFPEIAAALADWSRRLEAPVILDGEIVALDVEGQPTGFQQLQGRIHITVEDRRGGGGRGGSQPLSAPRASSTAYIVFDVLREGGADLRDRPFLERRKVLERLFARNRYPQLRVSEMVRGDGRALYKRALEHGWEGLIAKHASSLYRSGKRTPEWCKLKINQEQELVIGGWTEPRQTRSYFGALLLGVYERPDDPHRRGREGSSAWGETERSSASSASSTVGDLVYVGHTGTGFNERELARVMKLLGPLEIPECPFRQRPRTNERPHWVQPKLVAQIKFTEWTADAKLRHPVYLGLRDDKDPREVVRERKSRLHATAVRRLQPPAIRLKADPTGTPVASGFSRTTQSDLLEQLRALEDSRRDGSLELPGGQRLSVTNLHKLFWPKQKLTKGDLFRYYVEVAPFILPAVTDRPLVMKRFPNGVTAKPFYQHRVADVPAGVRVETVAPAAMPAGASAERDAHARHRRAGTALSQKRGDGAPRRQEDPGEKGDTAGRPHLVGGDLVTLLYTTQLAAISQDPWFSRIQSPEHADYAALDLDPMPGLDFRRTLEVARWIHDELESLGATGVPKTSGSEGLHIYIPLPPDTPYEAGLLFCRIVATVVAQKHPRHATIERAVAARGKRVYVDFLQNIQGKTLAAAYSARASEWAGVSTPLTWKEVHTGVDREDFTIRTVPGRLKTAGDLWAELRGSDGVNLSSVSRYREGTVRGRLKGDKR